MPEVDPKARRVEKAYDALVRLLYLGRICEDEPLREIPIARRLGMSRTPVREALNRLASTGLLVSTPTRASACENSAAKRSSNSSACARPSGPRPPGSPPRASRNRNLRRLRALCDGMDYWCERRTPEALYRARRLDARFHQRLMDLSGVPALADIYRRNYLLQLTLFGYHWTRLPEFDGLLKDRRRLGEEHRPLVEALSTRDPLQAALGVRRAVACTIEAHRAAMLAIQGRDRAEKRSLRCDTRRIPVAAAKCCA